MILDTSALVAILFEEPEAEEFAELIEHADVCRMSVVSRLELLIVLSREVEAERIRYTETFLQNAGVIQEPVSLGQGLLARNAFLDFGRGRHPAKLNFGDCFAYALAKALDEPLLFKGNNLSKTDVRQARRG